MAYHESEILELKQTLNKDFAKSVVAFLNTRDGTILIGVSSDGKVIGVDDVDKMMRDIRDIIRDQILPSTEGLYDISSKEEDGRKIIVVKVSKGAKLFYIKKEGRSSRGCYYRDGSSSSQMSEEEIERRFIQSIDYKRRLLKEIPIIRDDLKFDILKVTLVSKGIHIDEGNFLKSFNLITKNGEYNLLADLLSDENRISLSVCVFKGKDKSNYLMRNEYGNKSLLLAVKEVSSYCDSLNVTYVDVSTRPRKETKLFNKKAFEEAWINACVHNKRESGISPQIYVFDDRMEIVSEGGLPFGLTEDEFLSGVSKPVNPDLMDIFKSCNVVERSGHGVLEVVKVYGKEAYKFSQDNITVTIKFVNNRFEELDLDKNVLKNVHKNVLKNVHKNVGKNLYKNKVVELIKEQPNISLADLSTILDVSPKTVQRFLKDNNIAKRIGPKNGGYWKLIDE